MRPIRMKFNSDRQVNFRIQTSIYRENESKKIIKKALTKDAENHLNEMFLNQEVLKKIYPEYHICKSKKIALDEVEFEYLEGEEFAQIYERAIKLKDKKRFKEALVKQKNLILSCAKDNFCTFTPTEEYKKIFGDGNAFIESCAMKVSNFEFTSHNIILEKNTHDVGLIDYEYVFSFPIPVELIIFHCVIKTNMWTIADFDSLYSEDEILLIFDMLDRKAALESAWNKFNMFFGQSNLAVAKQKYLKSCENITEMQIKNRKMEQEILGNKNYISILTDNLGKQQYYIQTQKIIIEDQKNSILEKQQRIDNIQKQLQSLQEMLQEEQMKNVDLQNSVSWKATSFIRKIFDYIKK